MNFRARRIIMYGIGSLIVSLWAVFHVLTYFLSMIMCSVILAITLIMEAEYARIHHDDKTHHKKMGIALLIIILCTILILFEYST